MTKSSKKDGRAAWRFLYATCAACMLAACSSDPEAASETGSGGSTATGSGGGAGGAIGATGGGGSAGAGGSGGSASYQCTHVIGYSQVNQWYTTNGVFESVVDDARWQLRYNNGGGVDQWQDPNYQGWSQAIVSPCAAASDAPDRVLLSVSGPYGDDEAAWATAIKATVAMIEQKHPSATVVVLQPVVGGPAEADCMNGGQLVRASWQHKHIDAAIATAVGGKVVAGASPEVDACNDYGDAKGHLTTLGAEAAARQIGAFYLKF